MKRLVAWFIAQQAFLVFLTGMELLSLAAQNWAVNVGPIADSPTEVAMMGPCVLAHQNMTLGLEVVIMLSWLGEEQFSNEKNPQPYFCGFLKHRSILLKPVLRLRDLACRANVRILTAMETTRC